jgi:hypothetical protein
MISNARHAADLMIDEDMRRIFVSERLVWTVCVAIQSSCRVECGMR